MGFHDFPTTNLESHYLFKHNKMLSDHCFQLLPQLDFPKIQAPENLYKKIAPRNGGAIE